MRNGGFFVGYESEDDTSTAIAGQFINADGRPGAHSSGNDGPVNGDGFHTAPAVAARPGGVALVWRETRYRDIEFTTIGADGKNEITSATPPAGALNPAARRSTAFPDVATFADGDQHHRLRDYQTITTKCQISDIEVSSVSPAGRLSSDRSSSIQTAVARTLPAPASRPRATRRSSPMPTPAVTTIPPTTDNFDIRILWSTSGGLRPGVGRNGS